MVTGLMKEDVMVMISESLTKNSTQHLLISHQLSPDFLQIFDMLTG